MTLTQRFPTKLLVVAALAFAVTLVVLAIGSSRSSDRPAPALPPPGVVAAAPAGACVLAAGVRAGYLAVDRRAHRVAAGGRQGAAGGSARLRSARPGVLAE